MYLNYYKLNTKPFQISTDPRFLWLGEKHKEALAVLKYGILDNKGFLLLTGDVGTGKTTLLNALIASLGDEVLVALVTDPGLAKMDFFNFVADSFQMDKNFRSKGDFLIYLKNFLLETHRQGKQALLIIDECQHLNQKLLEEVRLLSNIEKYNTKLINIFFVGQSEFNEIILRPRNRAIRQRITINYNIKALTEPETEKYIRFRLQVAGCRDEIFNARAIKEVFRFSNGFPRLINIICDQALLTGYVKEKRKIDHKMVAECAKELKIPYGINTKTSMATPEAADPQPVKLTAVDIADETVFSRNQRQFNRPLVYAFIVVVIVWIGLVATFFLNRMESKSDVESGKGSKIGEFKIGGDRGVKGSMGRQASPAPNTSLGKISQMNSPSTANHKENSSAIGAKEVLPAQGESPQNDPAEGRLSLKEIQSNFGLYPEIHFDFNSNSLSAESYDMLALIARYCQQNPGVRIVLWGYTDRSGVRTYNVKLAEFRADMVKTYLVGKGVAAESITALGIGPDPQGPGDMTVPYDGSRRKVLIEIIPPDAS